MNLEESTIPVSMLKIPDVYYSIYGHEPDESLAELAKTIQVTGVYNPILISAEPDEDGRYIIVDKTRIFLAVTRHLGYSVVKYTKVNLELQNLPITMLFLNERKSYNRRMIVQMLPIFEEYYLRVIKPTKPNDRDHKRDLDRWISKKLTALGTPHGVRAIEKLRFITEYNPSLLDELGVSNPIEPVWKKVFNEVNGIYPAAPKPQDHSPSDNMEEGDNQADVTDDDDEYDPNLQEGLHGQEEQMRSYFGKKFCNPCRATWIWFNKLNPIEPLEGGAK